MQGLTDCLTFTVETEEDFEDRWLPTLDIKLRVDEENQIQYTFLEKPTGSDKCLQASTALNQNCLVRSLNNEVMRRLGNMSDHIQMSDKVEVLDKFCQKMTNSGHTLEVVRRSMISGLRGHLRKVERCKQEGKPFHRTAAAIARSRKTGKNLCKNRTGLRASQVIPMTVTRVTGMPKREALAGLGGDMMLKKTVWLHTNRRQL